MNRDVDLLCCTSPMVPMSRKSRDMGHPFRRYAKNYTARRIGLRNDYPNGLHMAPSYSDIVSFESMVKAAADPFGGHNDRWGSFSGPEVQ